jgi:hypothetical protein
MDGAGRQARIANDDQRAKDLQPKGLGQGGQALDDVCFFHISIIVE